MIHVCQPTRELGLQGVCGLLGKENIVGRDSGGFLLALGELVEQFQITWSISPLHEFVSGESAEVGFVLDLEGRHGLVVDHVGRGCSHCANLLLALRIIGDWLFPPKGLCESCELRAYDNFVRGEDGGASEPRSMKTFRLASQVGTRCHLGSCHAWCAATLRERLNRIGSVERGNDSNFTQGTDSRT